jgi:Lrp/AsnC family transcriptional regulator, leucine-responsive regulatory protein
MAHPVQTIRKNFDTTDLAIIRALQYDASQRLEDIARLTKLAPSSVHERLRRLERDGIIRGWTINVDSGLLGLGVLAYVGVSASKPCSDLIEALKGISAIEECHSVAGELSLLLKVRTSSTLELLDLSERLRQIPGIEGTHTTIVLKTHLDQPTAIPKSDVDTAIAGSREGARTKVRPRS